MPTQDNEIIYAVFAESVIIEGFGKILAPSPPLDFLIKRLIKVGARVSYHACRWYVHVASAFPLAHHYRAMLASGL